MDETLMLLALACVALAVLVYLMWRSATQQEWGQLTQKEKRSWRIEEEKRKEAS